MHRKVKMNQINKLSLPFSILNFHIKIKIRTMLISLTANHHLLGKRYNLLKRYIKRINFRVQVKFRPINMKERSKVEEVAVALLRTQI